MNYRQKKRRDSETPDLFTEPLTSYRQDNVEFIEVWNGQMFFPKLIPTDRQCDLIKNALLRPFFNKHWREAIKKAAASSFLMMKFKRFNLDWFCDRDNFDKIIEGFYDDQKPTSTTNIKTIRNGDDEEII